MKNRKGRKIYPIEKKLLNLSCEEQQEK